jgi:hypothetical protein
VCVSRLTLGQQGTAAGRSLGGSREISTISLERGREEDLAGMSCALTYGDWASLS